MGALKGSCSVRRYVVLDPLPARPRDRLLKGLRAHAFMPIDPKSELDRASGWVSMLDGDDADLQLEKVFFAATGGEQARFSLRVDVLKAPRAEVKRQAAARAAELAAKEGRELGRRERRLVEEEVARTLKLRAFPRVRVLDAVWNLDAQRVWFWSQAKAPNEAFVDLFVKSFGLKLDVDGPPRWASSLSDGKDVRALEPTPELWSGFEGVRPLGVAGAEEA